MVPLRDTPSRRALPGSVYRRTQPNKRSNEVAPSYYPFIQVENRRRPVQFSYHLHELRHVCTLWKGIIESMPEFCSRLVIFIGSNTTPLARIRTQIGKAGNCLLDVTVRSRGKTTMNKEMKQARAVMEILTPIVTRCRTFVFDVEHSSSLPVISRDFRGNAKHLRVLKLECQLDDGGRTPFYGARPNIPKGQEFKCPSLTSLAMDGNTFMDACFASWTKQLKFTYLDSLYIYGLDPPNPDNVDDDHYEEFDLVALTGNLTGIGFIRHLTLHSLSIVFQEYPGGQRKRHWDNLTLIGNDKAMVEEFIRYTYTESPFCYYHLADTGLEFDSVPAVHHLRLENIQPWDSNDFNDALRRHGGSVLDIVDCKMLDDANLEQIVKNCPNLRRLSLIRCPGITVKGLKNMIEIRKKMVEDDPNIEEDLDDEVNSSRSNIICAEVFDQEVNYTWSTCHSDSWDLPECSYRTLDKVHVERSLTLSKIDRAWFRERVGDFSWK